MIDREKYLDCIEYIDGYWKELTCKTPRDRGLVIGLPHAFISPSRVEFDEKMYYWDSFFTILGLLACGRVALSQGMANNLLYLFDRFGFIPQSNRFYHLGKSNPPFLTSIISEIFGHTGDRRWLRRAARIAAAEHATIWTGQQRLTQTGLSRYWEPTHTHEQAEDESGWDRTSRFLNKCLDINPVDLNCLLYKYEIDLAGFNKILGIPDRASAWRKKATRRKRLINKYMWDERRGFFFDYNYLSNKKTSVWSLAGLFPLWTGLANNKQATRLRNNIERFEHRGGLVATRRVYGNNTGRQWDYPNGWPNLHWIVIKGLLDHGFKSDAECIAEKWLNTCARVFRRTGRLWEKYDVVRVRAARTGRYQTQSGFAWTNAVFVKLIDTFTR